VIRRLLAALCIAILAGCATVVTPPAAPPMDAAQAEAAWARVLERHVDARGAVNFAALAADRGDLDRMLRHVADTPPVGFADARARLAHMINAYNALSMAGVIDSGLPASHAGFFAKLRFFVLRKQVIGGEALSLYAFENDVIRPFTRAIGEPRVHFALNCSARACPALPRQPFHAATLDAELARETLAFFARPENLRIDVAAREVWLSELLDFYREDFVPAHGASLIDYVNRTLGLSLPLDYTVRFTPYDWTVAHQPGSRP
jgi:Protein of unknown function, DUF547